jgi:Response regulator containing a CheY-like receiver domain and an HTH DNA-binding domain
MTRSHTSDRRRPRGRLDARDVVGPLLEESALHAARGVRPPARRVEPGGVGALVARLVATARQELLTFDDPSGCVSQGVPERLLTHAAGCMRRAVARVPVVRQITTPQGLARDAGLGTIQWRGGGEARLIEEIPFRMAVFDRTTALLPLDLHVFYNGVLVVRDPVVVGALVRLHRTWWRAGRDVAAREAHEPPAHLTPVLACLRDGLPDHAAAARLGLSPRTYARRVSELLTLLGAATRFQAAVAAVRRGWL